MVCTHLVDTTAVQEVAKHGLGVQSSLVQVHALGLRHEDGAAQACTCAMLCQHRP